MIINIYGAGNYAERYLPILKKNYQINFIMDKAPEKQGTMIYEIPIIAPSKESVNKSPIVILLNDIESGYKTLQEFFCQQLVYGIIRYAGGIGLYRYGSKLDLKQTLDCGMYIQNAENDFSQTLVQYTNQKYIPERRRYFNIASSPKFDNPGGPSACLRNLYLANEQYKLIDNFFTICPSKAFIPEGAVIHNSYTKTNKIDNKICEKIYESISGSLKQISMETLKLYFRLNSIQEFLKRADEKFLFQETDVFLLQDFWITQAFMYQFPEFKKVITVSHAQGSFRNQESVSELSEVWDVMQAEQLHTIKNWIFPSNGAKEGFLKTASDEMRLLSKQCQFQIAYNGYECKKKLAADKGFLSELEEIRDTDVIFASATFLYKNKGVEKIPEILANFKQQTNLRIKWILIGSGEMEEEVRKSIEEHLDEKDYIWYKKRFDNQDNVFALFSKADFYIMMHKVSVFDLSTLQAMAYGCIPVLSKVGGNLELCGFDNGILVDEWERKVDIDRYYENFTWNQQFLEKQKEKNKKIVLEKFNNQKFLLKYREYLYQM
ncbi:MAG: glycosyltransferase [Lachnospiraceae bacterium]|nr:glycosyltransferase [Lachnospiraceae bacterium]